MKPPQKYLADDRFQLALQVGLGMSVRTNSEGEGERKGEEAPSSGGSRQQEQQPASSSGEAEPMQVCGSACVRVCACMSLCVRALSTITCLVFKCVG